MMQRKSERQNADPHSDIVSLVYELIEKRLQRIPVIEFATVINVNPLQIEIDGLQEIIFQYDKNEFIVSDHLNLELNDRVLVLPIRGGHLYFVIAKFNQEIPISNASVGIDNNNFVGYRVNINSNRTVRYPVIFSDLWSLIRGSVGGIIKTLTHIGHYHPFDPNLIETSLVNGHTHTITLPDTDSAINPENP